MSSAPLSLLWTIVVIVIVLIVIIVLLKVVFAIIAIGPYAYAQVQAPSWPGGIAAGPPTTPNFADITRLVPGGSGWGFIYPIFL